MKYYVVLFVVMLASAAYPRDLTLDQALRLAEQHSYRVKQAEANLEASGASVTAAKAERLPTLSVEAVATYIDDVPSLEIEIPPLVSLSREFGANETYLADFHLTLPLYTGGRISSGIRAAQSEEAYRGALASLSLDQIQLRTRLDYLGLRRAMELRQAALASLNRTGILLDDVQNGLDAGVADSVDLLEARLARTRAEFAVRQADIGIRSSEIKLLVDLGLSPGETLRLTDSLPEPSAVIPATVIDGARPELMASASMVMLKGAQLQATSADLYPTLGLFTGYSYGKPNNDPFSGDWNDNITVGAQLQWSFNLGGRTSAKKKAVGFELEAARRYHDDLRESIDREVDLAFEQVKLAHERYVSARLEHRLTSDNYRLASNRHEAGVLSSNRLLEIEAALTAAEATMAAARIDFYIAQSGYLYATGDDNLGKGI